ncbi:MAG: biotin--[acetyl-CoA-carboxylase] ligase [Clostridiales bacterium]|nr:biotin--[acetyl-CoA-carboxylase] ligase [Clostridiales bacterium]
MKTKILDILKSAEGYTSGEKISEALGISRNAVWKHIKRLKEEGYNITSVTNRGYMLSASDILSPNEIKDGLNTRFIAQNIVYRDETDSTNNLAKRHCDMPDGTLFIADIQTGGKGRLGRAWSSPGGEGIWMSVLLKPDITPQCISQITLAAGLAVCRAISDSAMIKYPNDIVMNKKKVCGILTELSAEIDAVNYVMCGIGINVNTPSFPPELSDKATSLFIETGEKHCRAPIVRRVMEEFEDIYDGFIKNGISSFIDEYRSRCINIGRTVRIIVNRAEKVGNCVGIDDNGCILVETDGKINAVSSGEVSVRGLLGYV